MHFTKIREIAFYIADNCHNAGKDAAPLYKMLTQENQRISPYAYRGLDRIKDMYSVPPNALNLFLEMARD